MRVGLSLLGPPLLLAIAACAQPSAAPSTDWPVTGGDPGNTRYSRLDQINTQNVAQLRVAWTYHTGDLPPDGHGEIQATPIVVNGVLYTTTPALSVVALRADRGTLIWKFNPRTPHPSLRSGQAHARRTDLSHVNRGVVYWADGNDQRIFYTAGRRLYALDAKTGRPVVTFGDSGSVDLTVGLSRDVGDAYVVATSPGVIYKDLLVQGTRVGEEEGSAPGDVRAYDVRTGAIRWTFHTIPHPGEEGYNTWPPGAWRSAGGANSWAGMTVDQARGIVFIPTGSATPDFYGGDRAGANLFANSLLALDAATGRRLWHFQSVHHDLWDRDLPAAPNLVTVTRGAGGGSHIDAVAQIAKSGFVFLFDRESGKPLFPIEERPVPASDLRGEHAWPTQPFSVAPIPFARQSIGESDVTEVKRFRSLKSGALFMPPSREGTIVLPGFDGGGEWGGAAVDPDAVLYVNASDVPWIAAMRDVARMPAATVAPRSGLMVYSAVCAGCHGTDRRGQNRAPPLLAVTARVPLEAAREILQSGRGFMPSFANLPGRERRAVLEYLGYSVPPGDTVSRPRPRGSPYEFVGYERWRDSSGYPAIKPPWGTLSAIDLNSGAYRWRIPLGEFAELTARGVPVTGTEQYGGPIVTAGGLLFIAATEDAKLRAFDKRTGRLLWEATLPAPGYATPSTFAVRGKQYVVIAAGGGKLGSKSSDTYVAYALP
ncbi:MAG TPA: PQQ-binding-like beta-propeller repeat protein [Gemmatimonadales bacterium]|nr:PQQ-binding-like beta-propeller repeat protein [Gemmatimonadales bacterium]